MMGSCIAIAFPDRKREVKWPAKEIPLVVAEKKRSAFVAIKRFHFQPDKINSPGIYSPRIFVYHERIKVAYGGGRASLFLFISSLRFQFGPDSAPRKLSIKAVNTALCFVFLLLGCTATFFYCIAKRGCARTFWVSLIAAAAEHGCGIRISLA
jgi:hypothetical protein